MAAFEAWMSCNIGQLVNPAFLPGPLFQDDAGGNLLGVRVYRDGKPEALSGNVTARISKADGTAVSATGSIDGNEVKVILPANSCNVPGMIRIVIRVGNTTVGCFTGNVLRTRTNTIIS